MPLLLPSRLGRCGGYRCRRPCCCPSSPKGPRALHSLVNRKYVLQLLVQRELVGLAQAAPPVRELTPAEGANR